MWGDVVMWDTEQTLRWRASWLLFVSPPPQPPTLRVNRPQLKDPDWWISILSITIKWKASRSIAPPPPPVLSSVWSLLLAETDVTIVVWPHMVVANGCSFYWPPARHFWRLPYWSLGPPVLFPATRLVRTHLGVPVSSTQLLVFLNGTFH